MHCLHRAIVAAIGRATDRRDNRRVYMYVNIVLFWKPGVMRLSVPVALSCLCNHALKEANATKYATDFGILLSRYGALRCMLTPKLSALKETSKLRRWRPRTLVALCKDVSNSLSPVNMPLSRPTYRARRRHVTDNRSTRRHAILPNGHISEREHLKYRTGHCWTGQRLHTGQ